LSSNYVTNKVNSFYKNKETNKNIYSSVSDTRKKGYYIGKVQVQDGQQLVWKAGPAYTIMKLALTRCSMNEDSARPI